MGAFLHAVSSVTILAFFTALGCVCAHMKWLKGESKQFISKYLMNIVIPLNIIYCFVTNLHRSDLYGYAKVILVPLIVSPLLFLAAYALSKVLRLPRKQQGVFLTMCGLGNTLMIGLGLCVELFGKTAAPYVMALDLVCNSFTQLFAVQLIRRSGEQNVQSFAHTLARFARTPTVLAVLTSLGLIALDVQLPALMLSCFERISGTLTPLAMLLTGYIIYDIGLSCLRLDWTLIAVFGFRFLLSPALCLLFCTLLGISGLARNVLAVEMAMPVMILTVVAAAEYGADEALAARGLAFSTLACFFVIPILIVLI